MNKKIFVSVASYKDPELSFTLNSVMENAVRPNDLRIVVCQQDELHRFIKSEHSNIEFLNFDYRESSGVCWARSNICQQYDGEPYFLQIDSHMAMVPKWDELILEQIDIVKSKGCEKYLFAAYPTAYKIENNKRVFDPPCYFRTTIRSDNVFKFHHGFGLHEIFTEPVESKYMNAGLMFGPGQFYIDCPYDHEIYFEGEEILNTVKAFTHGYDLFNPSVHLAWHLYKEWNASEEEKQKWPQHFRDDEDRPIKSIERTNYSDKKLIKIFKGEMPEVLGNVRTIQDFEKYIGVPILKSYHQAL